MIVVTGASGFIASNLIRSLNRAGRTDVVAVDAYPQFRHRSGPCDIRSGVRYADRMSALFCLDLEDLQLFLDKDGSAVEAVVHLGACSDTMVTDREYVMTNNLHYSQKLWNWCVRAKRPFIYASSAATYGDGELGYDDKINPCYYRPLNLYAESKQLFDLWALRQSRSPPRWAGVKYFNVYGPNEGHKGRMASVVFHAFHQWMDCARVQLFQSHRPDYQHGEQLRDFIYVSDAVAATLHLLQTPLSECAPNGLYNVGTGQARTFLDLVLSMFSAVESEPRIDFIPMPETLRSKYQYFTQARIDKLRHAGYEQPFRSVEEGVGEYVRQYLKPQMAAASHSTFAA